MTIHKKYVFVDGNWEKLYGGSGGGGGGGESYIAGENIRIQGNVISAKDTTYTAGDGIEITNANVINNLIDISNYYNKTEIQDLLNAMGNLRMQIVEQLPAAGASNVIYLVKRPNINIYDQWIYQNYAWANIGDTSVDLTQFYTKTQMDTILEDYALEADHYTKTEADALLEDKQDALFQTPELVNVTDTVPICNVTVADKTVTPIKAQYLYTYIENKILDRWEQKFLNKIYPIGSIYTTVGTEDPADLFGGAWEIVGANRVLWGVGSSDTAGTTLSEQLPNIKGTWRKNSSAAAGNQVTDIGSGNFTGSGAITKTTSSQYNCLNDGSASTYVDGFTFNAANSSSVYTDDGIVRPNAYTVKFWKRTA